MGEKRLRLSRRAILGAAAGMAALGAVSFGPASAAEDPVRIGGSLALTGPLSQTAMIYKIVYEIYVDQLNERGGLLGRPVELVLYDDQSRAEVARSLYERLIAVDDVDLIIGPYATGPILAAVGVAQRYDKMFIQTSMGMPHLVPYERAFPSTPFGPDPDNSYPATLYDFLETSPTPPKSVAIITSKFPSAQYWSAGAKRVAEERGMTVPLYLEYEFGNRDFGAIAARIREANADLLWVGALGVDGNLLLDAMKQIDYMPPRQFYLFPAPGPMANAPDADNALAMGTGEEHPPFTDDPEFARFAEAFRARATAAGLPYPVIDAQALGAYIKWQMLEQAVAATESIDDAVLADWLKANTVDTLTGPVSFDGEYNHGPARLGVRQLQDGRWLMMWPSELAPPGIGPRLP